MKSESRDNVPFYPLLVLGSEASSVLATSKFIQLPGRADYYNLPVNIRRLEKRCL
jgi:hypothetical protein